MILAVSPGLFLVVRSLAYIASEALFLLGNLLPRRLAVSLWNVCLRLNSQHRGAAVSRALALLDRDREAARAAFDAVLEQLANRQDVSASDLYLTWIPGRAARKILSRLLWGAAAGTLEDYHGDTLIAACRRLARVHFRRGLEEENVERAAAALAALRSLGETRVAVGRGAVELAWLLGEKEKATAEMARLLEAGELLSPLQPLQWAEELLAAGERDLAGRCLVQARRFVPELPVVWFLEARLALARGETGRAVELWDRALALEPQRLEDLVACLGATRGHELHPDTGTLEIEAPAEIALGERSSAVCRIGAGGPQWSLLVLPPAGRGILPEVKETRFDATGSARVDLDARRPHRVNGEPWPLLFVAVGPSGYRSRLLEVRVPDPRPGRLLVTVTEDHEIHEERGLLAPAMLRRLLVEKSRFAADLGVPWTHMIETGSALAMPAWAADSGPPWEELAREICEHLVEEAARGNDLQPHLHAFNDPCSPRFPYRLDDGGWRPSLEFLLTAPAARGPWASACPPPGRGAEGSDRLRSVERSVAQVEEVARLGDPDYRAVLWRSGFLDYGATPADRAWSAVALRRAGLWADSDLPKPRSPRQAVVAPAFAAGWDPFEPAAGGPLLQLPIVANLEGDYRMSPRRLARRARASVAACRGVDGRPLPGVHLFTLLTHDKFINARAGGDEFLLDYDAGDWRTARRHMDAWRQAGATFVAARQGVREVLDDLARHPVPWLEEETFVPELAGGQRVRYRLRLLGRGLAATKDFPHHVLVPVPPSLRPLMEGVVARQRGAPLATDLELGDDAFWLRLEDLEAPIYCWLDLRRAVGPTLAEAARSDGDACELKLTAARPFRNARLLLPWSHFPALAEPYDESTWSADDSRGRTVRCEAEHDGLLLYPLDFHELAGGSLSLRLRAEIETAALTAVASSDDP